MIYQIENKDITDAMVNGAQVICWQFDGKYVLVSSKTELNDYVELYEDSERATLLQFTLWSQPCPGCNL